MCVRVCDPISVQKLNAEQCMEQNAFRQAFDILGSYLDKTLYSI